MPAPALNVRPRLRQNHVAAPPQALWPLALDYEADFQQLRQVGSVGLLTPHSVTPHPSRLCRWRTDQRSSFSFFRSLPLSLTRVLRSPTDSLALRNASFVAESFARRLLLVLLSQYLPSRVSAPIRYGWYCGWRRCSKVPVSSPFFGVCWTRPFSFSDSSLVGPRPFSLPMFHPARALCVVFVALTFLVRYWLGFYLT